MAYKEIERVAGEVYNGCERMALTSGEIRKLARVLTGKAGGIQEENENSHWEEIKKALGK